MEDKIMEIMAYLKEAYVGAKMMDDVEAMCRISRAIVMMETPSEVDVTIGN